MSSKERTNKKQRIATELQPVVEDASDLARDLGLDPYPVNYWVVDHDEMNELIAYDGFQTRYPHWRWGMKYYKQSMQDQYGGGKAFEIVNNDNPAAAFLQMSNSVADQKAVITHVEAHSDFFKNNRWFANDPAAADMLARHARKIQSYMDDPDIGREAVEKWIDHITTVMDHIDPSALASAVASPSLDDEDDEADDDGRSLADWRDELDISEDVKREVFDDEWLDGQVADEDLPDPNQDLLAYFILHGQQHDDEQGRAVEYETWQRDVLAMLRTEAYYFAPQKMTKCMNEGWAAYWESVMMGDEAFADDDEFITYADHQSLVLGSPGFNPYRLGKALWEYVENTSNRREVVDKLLRVEGITVNNFHRVVDFEAVLDRFDVDESYAPVKRHYSLARPQNRSFLQSIGKPELNRIARYMFDTEVYESVEAALDDVDWRAGWDRMFSVRETHNDISFIDEFLTQEFVDDENYFAYEYNHKADEMQVSSTNVDDVRKKLLLQFTNFGKPTIVATDHNFNNTGELLLEHNYNGVMLDIAQAEKTLERAYHLWGRPVNLKTIIKTSADGTEEEGRIFRYDGETHEEIELDWDSVENIAADEVDYDTKPEEWV